MHNSDQNNFILIGPDIKGLGGISRVARIWIENGILSESNSQYIATATDAPTNHIIFLLKALWSFIQESINGGKCVYIHTSSNRSFYRKSVFIGIAYLFRKKIVLHIHPSHFIEFVNNSRGFSRRYIQTCLSMVDRFVVLTNFMRNSMAMLYPDKPISVLSNPINFKEMTNTGRWQRAGNRLLYLGWYIPQKGVFDLVDAVERLVEAGVELELDFYGTKQIQQLKSYVNSRNLSRIVRVNGWISGDEKLKALYECTAIVLPSHSEGIPNVILEAMATHTPILATPVGGLSEILQDGVNAILTEPRNAVMLSEKIRYLLENKDVREKIAQTAYEDAMVKYDISVVKERFKGIIEGVCNTDYLSVQIS